MDSRPKERSRRPRTFAQRSSGEDTGKAATSRQRHDCTKAKPETIRPIGANPARGWLHDAERHPHCARADHAAHHRRLACLRAPASHLAGGRRRAPSTASVHFHRAKKRSGKSAESSRAGFVRISRAFLDDFIYAISGRFIKTARSAAVNVSVCASHALNECARPNKPFHRSRRPCPCRLLLPTIPCSPARY
jgi:hypothetical protein